MTEEYPEWRKWLNLFIVIALPFVIFLGAIWLYASDTPRCPDYCRDLGYEFDRSHHQGGDASPATVTCYCTMENGERHEKTFRG